MFSPRGITCTHARARRIMCTHAHECTAQQGTFSTLMFAPRSHALMCARRSMHKRTRARLHVSCFRVLHLCVRMHIGTNKNLVRNPQNPVR